MSSTYLNPTKVKLIPLTSPTGKLTELVGKLSVLACSAASFGNICGPAMNF